ncbi:MAG: hypothetical protein ACYC5F_09735 [Thermoleophilia bacterium]
MAWFHNPESGQTFEAEGYWEEEARSRGYEEVEGPDGAPPVKADETRGLAPGDQKGEEEGMTDETSSPANDAEVETPVKADGKAKSGKERK